MRFAAGGAAAVLIAVVLAGCGGSSQDAARRQLAGYLTAVDRMERQLTAPLSTVDSVDRQLTATSAHRGTGTARATGQATVPASSPAVRTPAQQQRPLRAPTPRSWRSPLACERCRRQGPPVT